MKMFCHQLYVLLINGIVCVVIIFYPTTNDGTIPLYTFNICLLPFYVKRGEKVTKTITKKKEQPNLYIEVVELFL